MWTGKWRIFDPWDFERRSWIPHSGWPIALDDLLPDDEETARDYGFGDFEAEARGEFFRNASYFLAPHGLVPHLDHWEKTPTRSGSRFFQELKQSANVDVILGANATEILLDGSLRTVRGIQFKSLDLRCFMLHADRFVLAAGGLEYRVFCLRRIVRSRPASATSTNSSDGSTWTTPRAGNGS